MNTSSSISDNESVSFNHDQPSFTTLQVPQPEQVHLASFYELQLINQQQQFKQAQETQNQFEMKSTSSSIKKYIKFKGFKSDKKKSHRNNTASSKKCHSNAKFDFDVSKIDYKDPESFSFDTRVFDVPEDQRQKIKRIKSSENILKTEETTLQFIPKRNFIKAKICQTPRKSKYHQNQSPHNISLPHIPNQNSEKVISHQQSSPNILNAQNFNAHAQNHGENISYKVLIADEEGFVCHKCKQFEIKKDNLCKDLGKIKKALVEIKTMSENVRIFEQILLGCFEDQMKDLECEIKQFMETVEQKNRIMLNELQNSQFITLFNQPYINNTQQNSHQISVHIFVDQLSDQIINLYEKQALFENSLKAIPKMSRIGKIKKNMVPKIQQKQQMDQNNKANYNQEMSFDYNHEISKIHKGQCDESLISIENINNEIQSNFQNFKNRSAKWEEATLQLNTPKFEVLTQSYDYRLQNQIEAYVQSKSEHVQLQEKNELDNRKILEQETCNKIENRQGAKEEKD